MKKLTILSIFSVILFSLFSCTLNMEEYIVPEEEKGFDKPVVEETEMGTIKYQFQDNVQVLTERVQKYIADVREDSIIYFMDNLPNEWMPQVGNCLFGKITRMLPYGMSAKVLSVSREGGLIKVVTTHAIDDEIFKQKEVEIDCDYTLQNIANLDKEGSNLTTLNDSVIVDWNYNDGILPDYAAEEDTTKVTTRAETEERDETTHKSYSFTGSVDIPVKNLAGLHGTASLEVHVKKKLHFKETKGKYREEWTIDQSYEKVTFEVGIKGENIQNAGPTNIQDLIKNAQGRGQGLKDYLNNCVNRRTKGTDFLNGASLTIPIKLPTKIHVPIGGICYFEFGVSGSIDITPSIFGKIVFVHYHQQKKEGEYRYIGPDGEEYEGVWGKEEDRVEKPAEFKVTDYDFCGDLAVSISVSASVEVGVGLGGDTFGIGLGATASITFTAGAKINLGANWHEDNKTGFIPLVELYANMTWAANAYCAVGLFGFKINHVLFGYSPSTPNWAVSTTLTPKLSTTNSKAVYANYVDAANTKVQCVEATFNFSHLFNATIYPLSMVKYMKCRIYVDDKSEGKYIELYPLSYSSSGTTVPNQYMKNPVEPVSNHNYKFVVPVNDILAYCGEYKRLTIVPVFWGDGSNSKELVLSDQTLTIASAQPVVSSGKGEQLSGIYTGEERYPYQYSFALLTKFENTSDVEEIGYQIIIRSLYDTSKVYYDNYIPVTKGGVVKSGYYRTRFTFNTNYDASVNGALMVFASPRYTTRTDGVGKDAKNAIDLLLKFPVDEHKPSWYNLYKDHVNDIDM